MMGNVISEFIPSSLEKCITISFAIAGAAVSIASSVALAMGSSVTVPMVAFAGKLVDYVGMASSVHDVFQVSKKIWNREFGGFGDVSQLIASIYRVIMKVVKPLAFD